MKALDVSTLFLAWAQKNGGSISNLKMQKLLYYAYVWHLVKFKKPLFSDKIKACAFGPVIESVYDCYKHSCFCPIQHSISGKEENIFTKKQLDFLRRIYDTFMPYTPKQLMTMSQLEEPWLKSYRKNAKETIPDKLMVSFYSKLLKSGRSKNE